MELRGLTPVDSLYEYSGLRLATELGDIASSFGVPIILALAGLAYVVHTCLDKGSLKDAAVHVFYLMLMAWLLGKTEMDLKTNGITIRERLGFENRKEDKMPAPRFLALADSATTILQRKSIEKINAEFLNSPFERERLVAIADSAQVFDGVLLNDLWSFRLYCWMPAVAKDPRQNNQISQLDPLAEGSFDYSAGAMLISDEGTPHLNYPLACKDARPALEDRVNRHLQNNPVHRDYLQKLARASLGVLSLVFPEAGKRPVEQSYRALVVRRAMLGGRKPSTASWVVRASLPSQEEARRSSEVKVIKDDNGWQFLNQGIDRILSTTGELKQDIETTYTTKQKLYLAVLYGPYLYGLSLMIVLGLFPVVGLVALLPGRWRALVNYGKVLLSIKLWPVCWAALTRFHALAPQYEVFGDGIQSGDLVVVIASMYLLTPALCFAMVSLATSVTALPFQQAAPGPAGSALGDAVGAVRSVPMRVR